MGDKYEILTEVLAPEREVTREIKGFHPSGLLKFVPGLIKEVLKCQSSDFFEDRMKWDVSNPKLTQFYGEWRGRNTKDKLTDFWIRIIVHGYQNPVDKIGHVKFRIYGYLETNLDAKTPIHLLMNYIYFKTFYVIQLRYYLEESKEEANEMDQRMRDAVTKPK